MGDQVADILKSLYSQINQEPENLVSKVARNTSHASSGRQDQAKPLLEEIMEKNSIGHIYGYHERNAKKSHKDFNNIRV